MKFKHSAIYAAVITATLGMAGCNNNTSSSSAANVTGRITGFGSVFVNGVEYETNGSVITGDGTVISETDLNIGMIVTVNGTDNGVNGNAVSIEYNDNVEGIVTANDGTTLTVMGYTVTIDNNTNFEGFSLLTDIAVGAVVEISGYPDAANGILATMIELKNASYTAGDDTEVKGTISALDTTAMTFTLGTLTVNYTGASLDFVPADGLYVEVHSTQALTGNTLIASAIQLENNGDSGHDGNEGEELEFEGLITAIDTTANTITVGTDVIQLPDGYDISAFAVGDLVDMNVVVVAGNLTLQDMESDDLGEDHAGAITIVATLGASDIGTSSVTVMGITYDVNSNDTMLIDHSAAAVHYFSVADLVAGDRIEIEGYPNPDGSGRFIATSLERKAATTDINVVIEGTISVVTDTAGTTVSINGITLDLSGLLTPPTLADGDKVEAVGSYDAGILTVTEIGIHN